MSIPRNSRFQYSVDPAGVPDDTVGIALSGGGIRAACLGLGALQMAEELGVFGRAKYVSAVSGGSYIATAFIAARAQGENGDDSVKPWGRGSGEEAHLRRNLSYLGEDLPDRCLALVHYVIRTTLHQVQFLAGLVLISSTLGAAYRSLGVLVSDGDVLEAEFRPLRLVAIVVVLISGAMLDVSRAGREDGQSPPARLTRMVDKARLWSYDHRVLERRAVIAIVGVLLLPDLIAAGSQAIQAVRFGHAEDWTVVAVASLAFVFVAIFVLRSQKTAAEKRSVRILLRGARACFSLSIIGLFATPLLVLVGQQAQWDLATNAVLFAAAGGVLLMFGFFVHANWTSMHDIYARRLTRAYIVTEPERRGQEAGCGTARHHRRLDEIALRCLSSDEVPELLVCAAVNMAQGESAQGEGSGSFVFSPNYVGGPGNVGITLEFLANKRCSDVVAASGAAVAPNMGRLTRRTVRVLLAFLNLRLGMWVLVPSSEESANPVGLKPHGCLHRDTSECLLQGKCDRLKTPGVRSEGVAARLMSGWREPGPYWTWKEALGDLSLRDGALFISDGGHWDNSGIIELLRRGCRTIFAVDAAVDDLRVSNLVRAISLARSELGVEIAMTGSELTSKDPVLRLTFLYPGQDASGPRNVLIVMRTFVTDDMPTDLVAMSRSLGVHGLGSVFPRHVTLNQFLLARDVDGYITLGRWLFEDAVRVADLRPPAPRSGRRGSVEAEVPADAGDAVAERVTSDLDPPEASHVGGVAS